MITKSKKSKFQSMLFVMLAFCSSAALAKTDARFSCKLVQGAGPKQLIVFVQEGGGQLQLRYFPQLGATAGQVDISARQKSSDGVSRVFGDFKHVNPWTREELDSVIGAFCLDAKLASAKAENDYQHPLRGSAKMSLNGEAAKYGCFELLD